MSAMRFEALADDARHLYRLRIESAGGRLIIAGLRIMSAV